MKTTKLVVGAVGLATALAASGCAAAGTSGGSGSGGSGSVRMVAWPGPEGEAMAKVVKQYNQGQGKKDGVNVRMVTLTRGDLFSKEAVEMTSHSSKFDIYYTSSYVLQDHAPYLAAPQVDGSKYGKLVTNGFTVNGKLMAVPLDVSTQVLYYRKDLINGLLKDHSAWNRYKQIAQKEVGKSLTPKAPADWSWDDYLAMAAYFTKSLNPSSPTQYGTTLPAKNSPFQAMQWNSVLWSFGGSWDDPSGKFNIVTPAATKAVNLYADAYQKKIASPQSAQGDFPELQSSMSSGNVAFIMQWSSAYAALNDPAQSKATAGKVGIAPIPGAHRAHVHIQGVALNKESKKQAAAQKFLKYLNSEAAMKTYAAGGVTAAMASVADNAKTPIAKEVNKIANGSGGFVEPQVPGVSGLQVDSALATALSPAWVGQTPAKQALQNAQAAVEKLSK